MRKAGAWPPGRIHDICGSWAERRMEVRERRREKGGEVWRPRQELARAGRRWTGAGDGGIWSRPVERHQPGHRWRRLDHQGPIKFCNIQMLLCCQIPPVYIFHVQSKEIQLLQLANKQKHDQSSAELIYITMSIVAEA
ncbi:uncharacterized protein [Triticum aestivum]|uniref:uncharacterized protein n=1 Tax=Triticum aestivum TaxID=4565 RepID=UPI001D00D354|nr:uncharacterized protein LOC123167438 [Triticum aestivum]